ncbi:protein of unknown function [Denitratisoma oestradiolicum]|uniref:Uncharacterized protein n=1 Tax=Denitratisoma oestradiolicum TaxID=311182 RepID=A0A6S6XZZ8_9PROT|nr:protein of unknown function [Denitratisoma oestradiolicum]
MSVMPFVLSAGNPADKTKVASLTPGTCKNRLWLLPSGPDQIHRLTMRGDPPQGILTEETHPGPVIPAASYPIRQ